MWIGGETIVEKDIYKIVGEASVFVSIPSPVSVSRVK